MFGQFVADLSNTLRSEQGLYGQQYTKGKTRGSKREDPQKLTLSGRCMSHDIYEDEEKDCAKVSYNVLHGTVQLEGEGEVCVGSSMDCIGRKMGCVPYIQDQNSLLVCFQPVAGCGNLKPLVREY